MTPIEIMALIIAGITAIKLVVILVKPNAWLNNVEKPIWKNPALTMIISLIGAAVVLYYLLQELTIVQIFAAMLFLVLLMAAGISVYAKELMDMATKLYKIKGFIRRSWLYILIWIALTAWVFYALFA